MVSSSGHYERYAIYFTARGSLGSFGASWLGWDVAVGQPVEHPVLDGITCDEIRAATDTPRKYGFHATLKAPFRLVEGMEAEALEEDLTAIVAATAPVTIPEGLEVTRLGSFLALTPAGPQDGLVRLAAKLVRGLDAYRAPMSEADRAKRNPDQLSETQRANLDRWGYAYVMDGFRFHMTLTGSLEPTQLDTLEPLLRAEIGSTAPFSLRHVTLAGQDRDGMFHEITRIALTGSTRERA